MADTEIRFAGIPSGLDLDVRIRDLSDLSILETVEAMSETGDYYYGDVTASLAGFYVFEFLFSGGVAGSFVGEIPADDAGPYPITGLDSGSYDTLLKAIKTKTDTIGNVTFVIAQNSVSSDGSIIIKAGDKHVFTLTSDTADVVPDLTGVTIRFGIKGNTTGEPVLKTTSVAVLVATGLQSVQVTLLPAETILLAQGAYHFDLQAEFAATDHQTFLTGSVQVNPDYSGVP